MMTVSRRYYSSSSFKMATLFTILLGCSSLLLSYFLYNFSHENFIRETQAAIDNEIENILLVVENKKQNEISSYINQRALLKKHTVYLYNSNQGHILAGNLLKVPANLIPIKEGLIKFHTTHDNKKQIYAAKVHTFIDGSLLLVGRDIGSITQSYKNLILVSGIIIAFMFLVVLISFLISTFVVKRINIIAETAQTIMNTGDLSQRISISTHWDDLSNLAQVLNALLDRIEHLMQGIKDVTNNIAHDLRTPLTRLKNQLEENEKYTLAPNEKAALVAEADQLLNIFNSLLRIAYIEKGNIYKNFKSNDLSQIIYDVIELYEPLSEKKEVTLTSNLSKNLYITGDSNLLFQLFLNLIDNAIKYATHNVSISSAIITTSSQVEIIIKDDGVGISPEEYEKVFERFYRSDKSRNTTGNGLGLSMVKAVLELHKGSIKFSDNNPGLTVSILLPLVK